MTWILAAPAPVRMTSNSSFSSTSAGRQQHATGRGGGDGDGGRRGHAELLLEHVEEVLQLEHGECADGVEDLFLGSHGVLLLSESCGGAGCSGGVGRVGRLEVDEGREAVGEVAGQGLQQAGGLDQRGLQGAGELRQQLLAATGGRRGP